MCPTGKPERPAASPAGKYISISAGEYRVGLSAGRYGAVAGRAAALGLKEEYIRNCMPAHTVTLGRADVSTALVTCTEFAEFIESTGYVTEAEKDGWAWTWEGGWMRKSGLSWRYPFGGDADEIYRENAALLPVLQATWNDAAAWCRWRSETYGKTVRLPLEAEWEVFASMSGVKPAEEAMKEDPGTGPGNSDDYIIAMIDTIRGGIHTTGFVWEWCDDWLGPYPGGLPHKEFGEVYKVLRGGSLMSAPLQKSAEYRFRRCPTARSPYYGFRIALD